MGRWGLLLLLAAALCAGARGREDLGEPGPPLPELCLLPKVVGRCRAAFPRWWYNATSQACQRFTFGGCEANLNNFLAEDECRRTCAPAADRPAWPSQPASNLLGYEEYCAAPQVIGPCRAAFPRWYYDPAAGTCKQFIYGGCKGNRNNYQRQELCLRQCTGATGGAEGSTTQGPEVHSTRVVVLAVLLAVLVALLLGCTVVALLRLRRSPELDKEHLMSGAYVL
ncbi:kunitz-type protease inhibitor 2 [Carettochelys insculpta]|uniref:kunitz-type protease inhibitor 2 n=1 Tax=Carettochelys insculpta TaxID=44489 RepID=UPI003EC0CB2D